MNKGVIYRAFLPSGMSYIGQTTDLPKRIKKHFYARKDGNLFHTAIVHFGMNAFSWEVLEEVDEDKLNERELFWIDYYNTLETGFNADTKGYVIRKSAKQVGERISSKLKGRVFSDNHRNNLRKAKVGCHLTEEHKRNIGNSGRGKKRSDEFKVRMKKSMIGNSNSKGKHNLKLKHWKLVDGHRVYYNEEQ